MTDSSETTDSAALSPEDLEIILAEKQELLTSLERSTVPIGGGPFEGCTEEMKPALRREIARYKTLLARALETQEL